MNGLFKFCILLFFCFSFYTGVSQESLQRHTVSDGETIASIAKTYKVSTDELQKANVGLLSGIKVNDVLIIPQNSAKSDGKTTYTVKRGDTKFSLARSFGLTIKALESLNPQIVPTLLEGQILNYANENHIKKLPVKLESYVVTKADTKFGIAKKFNTTIAELERVNPYIVKMLLVGQTIQIPSDNFNSTTSASNNANDTVKTAVVKNTVIAKKEPTEKYVAPVEKAIETLPPAANSNVNTSVTYTNLAASLNTSKQKKLLFFLPFSQSEYQSYKIDDNFDRVSDKFKKSHLEFYRGANLAIDSIKKLKLNIEVDILEAKNKIKKPEIESLAKLQQISTYDAVILPYYDAVDEELAALIEPDNIPVITASLLANQNPSSNLYSALPAANLQRKKILDYLRSKKGNIIIISDVDRDQSRAAIAEHAPNATIIDLDTNGTFSKDELIGKLKKNQVNYVILDSERNSVFISSTNILLSELSNYDIQIAIMESNLIPDKSDVSVKRYQILRLLFPSFVPAQTPSDTNNFTAAYLKKYDRIPTENVLLGFDITMDTLLRMAQEGSFQNSAENQVTAYTYLKFDYEKNAKGGYGNHGIYILHYDSGYAIKEIN